MSKETGQPWKQVNPAISPEEITSYLETYTNCSNKEDEELKECMEDEAYSREEAILSTNHGGEMGVIIMNTI